MHQFLDLEGGMYLDRATMAAAGFRPGQRVDIFLENGQLVLRGGVPVVRPVQGPASMPVRPRPVENDLPR